MPIRAKNIMGKQTKPAVDILLLISVLRDVTRDMRWLEMLSSDIDALPADAKQDTMEFLSIMKKASPLKQVDAEVLTSKIRTAFNSGDSTVFNKTVQEEAKDLTVLLAVYKLRLAFSEKQKKKREAVTGRHEPEVLDATKVDELALSLGLTLPSL